MDFQDADGTGSVNEGGVAERRSFLVRLSSAVMGFGLAVGYGMFGWLIGRFLYPTDASSSSWQFLADLASFPVGKSMTYNAPAGQKVVVTRLAENGVPEDFIALSSVCPHLGCAVHWEANNDRFFCPCHNGAFSSTGDPLSGPPADAGQTLSRYPLKVDGGLLFVEVPAEALV
jgi:cytochrome b6-f complex iron-sulfur subunit